MIVIWSHSDILPFAFFCYPSSLFHPFDPLRIIKPLSATPLVCTMSSSLALRELEENIFWAIAPYSEASEDKVNMINPQVSRSSSPTTTSAIHQNFRGKKGTVFKNHKADGDHHDELHICTERERRKKMRNMFSVLHSFLPQLTPKADKSTIVDEAVKYIKTLEHTLKTLQQQKADKILMMNEQGHGAPSMPKSLTLNETGESIMGDHHHGHDDHHHQHQVGQTNNLLDRSSSFETWFSPNVVVNMCGDSAQFSVCSPKKPGLSATISHILEKHKLHVFSAHIFSDHYRCMYMIHARVGADHLPEALSVEDIFTLAAGEMNLSLLSC